MNIYMFSFKKMNIYIYIYIYIYIFGIFFLYHLRSVTNKLDKYIYTYFCIIPIIPLNNFFYNTILVGVLKK